MIDKQIYLKGLEVLKLLFDTQFCTGCRMCELACSFYHGHVFKPSLSSIKINKFDEGNIVRIELFLDKKETHNACSFCKEPLCIKYCYQEEARKELEEIFKKASANIRLSG